MRSLAVFNPKGGVGKTTTVVNLAAALGDQGHATLVLDLDPEHHATSWLGLEPEDGLREVFLRRAELAPWVRATRVEGVSALPSHGVLAEVAASLPAEPDSSRLLAGALVRLPDDWSFLLIDCPPGLGILAENALAAVREVLVPVETSALSFAGVDRLLRGIDRVREKLNPDLAEPCFLACRTARSAVSRRTLERLRSRFSDRVLHSTIRESARLAEAPEHRLPITRYFPGGGVAEDFRALSREIVRRGEP